MCRAAFVRLTGVSLVRELDAFRWHFPLSDELAFSITVHVVRNRGGGFPPCDLALYVCESERDAVDPWFKAAFSRNTALDGWVVCGEKVRQVLEAGLTAKFRRLVFAAENLEGVAELAPMIRAYVQRMFEGPIARPMGDIR
jgi:hypothetical protein